jgi:hypothetical protein
MASKRKRTTTADPEESETRESKRFAWLKPHVKNVSKHTIKSKWTALPEPVQDKVRNMFRSLERPVIVRQRDERKRIEAQTALSAVVKTYVLFSTTSCSLMVDVFNGIESNLYLLLVSNAAFLACHSRRLQRMLFLTTSLC